MDDYIYQHKVKNYQGSKKGGGGIKTVKIYTNGQPLKYNLWAASKRHNRR